MYIYFLLQQETGEKSPLLNGLPSPASLIKSARPQRRRLNNNGKLSYLYVDIISNHCYLYVDIMSPVTSCLIKGARPQWRRLNNNGKLHVEIIFNHFYFYVDIMFNFTVTCMWTLCLPSEGLITMVS